MLRVLALVVVETQGKAAGSPAAEGEVDEEGVDEVRACSLAIRTPV